MIRISARFARSLRVRGLGKAEQELVTEFCEARNLKEEYEFFDWLRGRIRDYIRLAGNESTSASPAELIAGREVFKSLRGVVFAPDTLVRSSFSDWMLEDLALTYGSREELRLAALEPPGGAERIHPHLTYHGSYAAWVFGFIPLERLMSGGAQLHTKRWNHRPRKKRRRGS